MLLAMANVLLRENRFDREFVRRWVNWEEYLATNSPERAAHIRRRSSSAEEDIRAVHAGVRGAGNRRHGREAIVEVAHEIARAGSAFSTHIWRNAGGRQPRRLAGRAQPWSFSSC